MAAADTAADATKRINVLERLIALDPLNESAVRDLAHARAAGGDRAGARRDLTALIARLRSELQVEPEEQTLRALSHYLERAEASTATNLPIEHDSFVGRESAVHDVAERLNGAALLTICGSAGVGKTRLALRVASNSLGAFPDGVWWVDLAPVKTWKDAISRIGAVLQLTIDAEDAASSLRAYLERRKMLLVLDNLEQIEDAAASTIADLVRGGATKVLATSRRRLDESGELSYTVDTLGLPPSGSSPQAALQFSAVRLFCERAAAVAPAFELSHENVAQVISIVHRLDGLPLAIELVAARANLLTIEGIAKRLHDPQAFRRKSGARRHETVSSAIRWSFDLLSSSERGLLSRLAVFEGDFDLAAIEAICAPDEHYAGDIFGLLSELVEASLTVCEAARHGGELRYRLLETVRQFVLKTSSPSEEMRAAHARYYAQLALAAERSYEEIGASEYVRMLRRDETNMEAAMRYAWEKRDAMLLGSFAAAFVRLWPSAEMKARAHIFTFLASEEPESAGDPRTVARVKLALAAYYSTAADWKRCKMLREQAAASWRGAGDEAEALMADAMVAYVDNYLGASLRDETIPRLYGIARRLREIGAPAWHRSRIEANLAAMELSLGHVEKALSLALDALPVFRSEARTNYLAAVLATLSRAYIAEKAYDLAGRCIEESIALLGDPAYAVLLGQAFGDRAQLRLAMGDAAGALESCCESLETFERAFELRFVTKVFSIAMQALNALGMPEAAARIAGYVLAHARSTGTVSLAASFESSPAFGATRETLGSEFDRAARLGATLTYAGLCAEIKSAAGRLIASPEDDSRTIRSL